MANEKRLIDANNAQAVLVNMAEHLMEAGNPEMAGAVGYAADVIGKQRTVDAVEVVRCKDCRKWLRNEPSGTNCRVCADSTRIRLPYDFCSYGEKRLQNK